jgi:hypothetical protein
MSLRDDYCVAAQENCDPPPDSGSADASQTILLSEYGALLRTIEPLRIINRIVVIGLSLVQGLFSPSLLSKQIALQIVAALACGFWFLQEFVTGRKLGRLGELIAATNADAMNAAEGRETRSVVLPPPKKESPIGQTPSATSNTSQRNPDMTRISSGQSWTNSYISWRQEAWKNRRFLTLQRSEPIIWFVLILTVEVYRLVAGR